MIVKYVFTTFVISLILIPIPGSIPVALVLMSHKRTKKYVHPAANGVVDKCKSCVGVVVRGASSRGKVAYALVRK